MTTITKQIIGGLALELDARLPNCHVILGIVYDDPAVKVDQVFVVLDQDMLKVVVPCDLPPNASHGMRGLETRRVLFSCPIISPGDDFVEELVKFFQRYETDFDSEADFDAEAGIVPPFREDAWTIARSAANSSK